MPRVKTQRANKPYPAQGIEKGDIYYSAKFKTGPASGMLVRWKTYPTPSQLTRSPFKSGFLAAGENWQASDKDSEAIREAAETIRELGQEAQGSFDNMPEGLQQGETGQGLENRASECERIADELDTLAGELEDLEEPETMEEPDEEDDGESDAWQAFNDWQEEHDHYQTELARIPEEADALIEDMPE